MSPNRRYRFNLPWPTAIFGAAAFAGLSAYVVYLGREYAGAVFAGFIVLSAVPAICGVVLISRRLMFPRVLELTDDAILYPGGFLKTRIRPIPYADILRIVNH